MDDIVPSLEAIRPNATHTEYTYQCDLASAFPFVFNGNNHDVARQLIAASIVAPHECNAEPNFFHAKFRTHTRASQFIHQLRTYLTNNGRTPAYLRDQLQGLASKLAVMADNANGLYEELTTLTLSTYTIEQELARKTDLIGQLTDHTPICCPRCKSPKVVLGTQNAYVDCIHCGTVYFIGDGRTPEEQGLTWDAAIYASPFARASDLKRIFEQSMAGVIFEIEQSKPETDK